MAKKEETISLIDTFSEFKELKLSLIHISEPTRLGMISYAVFCLKKKKYIVCRLLLEKKKRNGVNDRVKKHDVQKLK